MKGLALSFIERALLHRQDRRYRRFYKRAPKISGGTLLEPALFIHKVGLEL